MFAEASTEAFSVLDNTTTLLVSSLFDTDLGYATTEGFATDRSEDSVILSGSAWDNFSVSIPLGNASIKETSQLAIAESDVKLFSYLTRTFVNPALCILGFVGNSLGVGVLKRQARQQNLSILWYLFALTVTDIMFLGQGLIDSLPRLAYVMDAIDEDLSKYLMAHFRTGLAFFDLTFLHSARYIVVVMSCERLISVVKPLHVKDTWFAKYPLKIVLGCVIFNALIALPMLIFATVITQNKGNNTEYIFTFKHYDDFMSQWWIVEATFHSFVPMIVLVPINIAIPFKLYRASTKLSTELNKDVSKQQRKVTITVMAITMLYIFLSIPFLVMKILQYADPDFNMQGKYRLYFWFIADLGRCLGYLNAANDFLVYFLVSNNYRAVFKAMYCSSCGRKSAIQSRYQINARYNGSRETVSTSVSDGKLS